MSTTNWIDAVKKALHVGDGQPVCADLRTTFRIPCDLPVQLVTRDGMLDGTMVDASTRGLKVQVAENLRRGQRLDVLLHSRRGRVTEIQVVAQVIWCKRAASGFDAGLEFVAFGNHRPADILALLRQELPHSSADDQQKRRSQRLPVRWPVSYTSGTSGKRMSYAKDISRHGILLEATEPLTPMSDLSLVIEVEGVSEPVRAHGVVRRCTPVQGKPLWNIASPLLDMSTEDRACLEAAIKKRLHRS